MHGGDPHTFTFLPKGDTSRGDEKKEKQSFVFLVSAAPGRRNRCWPRAAAECLAGRLSPRCRLGVESLIGDGAADDAGVARRWPSTGRRNTWRRELEPSGSLRRRLQGSSPRARGSTVRTLSRAARRRRRRRLRRCIMRRCAPLSIGDGIPTRRKTVHAQTLEFRVCLSQYPHLSNCPAFVSLIYSALFRVGAFPCVDTSRSTGSTAHPL